MNSFSRIAAGLAATALITTAAAAQVTIGTVGNAGNGSTYPFGFSGGYTKFQQIYSSTLFSSPLSIGSVSFYSKPGTEILQQGTFNIYFNTTATTAANANTGNPGANEVAATRSFFGTFVIGLNVDAPSILTFTGTNTFNYNPASGNLVLDVDFAPVGNLVNSGRAAFDRYFDAQGGPILVATSSDPQAFFGVTAGSRGAGLVTTFAAAATVVPEPSTVLLLSGGLAVLGLVTARRQKMV